MGKLIVYSSKANKQLFDLPADCNTVGRDHGNAIRIRHSSVSGKHGTVTEDPNGWLTIRDLGSTNGTTYQGQEISEATVYPGEQFQFGDIVIEYAGAPVAAPIPAAQPVASTSSNPITASIAIIGTPDTRPHTSSKTNRSSGKLAPPLRQALQKTPR